MEVVIEILFVALSLSLFHFLGALLLVPVAASKLQTKISRSRALSILVITSLITFILLSYNIASATCGGRMDFASCATDVMIAAGKMGIVLIPFIIILGMMGYFCGSFITRKFITPAKMHK